MTALQRSGKRVSVIGLVIAIITIPVTVNYGLQLVSDLQKTNQDRLAQRAAASGNTAADQAIEASVNDDLSSPDATRTNIDQAKPEQATAAERPGEATNETEAAELKLAVEAQSKQKTLDFTAPSTLDSAAKREAEAFEEAERLEAELRAERLRIASLEEQARQSEQRQIEVKKALAEQQELARSAEQKLIELKRIESDAQEAIEKTKILRLKAQQATERQAVAEDLLAEYQGISKAAEQQIKEADEAVKAANLAQKEAESLQSLARIVASQKPKFKQEISQQTEPEAPPQVEVAKAEPTMTNPTVRRQTTGVEKPDVENSGQNTLTITQFSPASTSRPRRISVVKEGLFVALKRGQPEPIKAFLARGESPDVLNAGGVSLLASAARHGNRAVVEWLLDAGANVDLSAGRGRTALIFAAIAGNNLMVERLIAAGADVNAASSDGKTALMAAAINNHLSTIDLLIEAGARLNEADNNGRTALFFAVLEGHEELANLLIGNGANTEYVDLEGKTLAQMAEERGIRLFEGRTETNVR